MQTATIAKKPRRQAISGRFWAGRTYRGRIKDDHKIEKTLSALIQTNDSVKKTKKTKPCSKRQIPMVA